MDTADTIDDTGLLEMEPMNELLVGKNVNLRFMVKTKENDSPLWFAQVYQTHQGLRRCNYFFFNDVSAMTCRDSQDTEDIFLHQTL